MVKTVGVLWLPGCQSVPVEAGLSPAQFFLEARVSLQVRALPGEGQLTWYQQGEAYRVTAFGPFGAGLVVLEGMGQSATRRMARYRWWSPTLSSWLDGCAAPLARCPTGCLSRPAPGLGAGEEPPQGGL